MRPLTKWELFKARFVWGQWSWFTYKNNYRVFVLGKFKYLKKANR